VLVLYLFCSAYLVPVYPHFVSANELAHWVIVAGLVEHGTLDERWSEPLIGRLVDSTRAGEAIHSNKPPGLALVSAPGYLLVRLACGPPNPHNLRWYLYAMHLFGATVPVAVLGLLLLRRRDVNAFGMAVLLFGTCLFFYGAMLFSHALAALFVYASYRLLFGTDEEYPRQRRDAMLAGAAAGFATLTEYTAALSVFVFGAALLFSRRGRRRQILPFLLGGVPLAALFAAFNWVMFRSVFTLSRSHEAWFSNVAYTSRGFWGTSLPSAAAFWQILLSPSRGLFFYSPVLLLALFRRPADRAARVRIALTAVAFLFLSSYSASDGGWGAGTRYLVFVLPVVADAFFERREAVRFPSAALLAFSIALCVVPALTFVFAPPEFPWLHSTLVRPFLERGFYMPNLGALIVRSPATLVPVVAAAGLAFFLAVGEEIRSALAGSAAGLAAAAIVVFLPVGLSPFLLIERQILVETYFQPEGQVAAAATTVRDPALARQLASLAQTIQAARAYPPDDWPYRDVLIPR
jgi:hypothetical protein